jgi:hypothetical protein
MRKMWKFYRRNKKFAEEMKDALKIRQRTYQKISVRGSSNSFKKMKENLRLYLIKILLIMHFLCKK